MARMATRSSPQAGSSSSTLKPICFDCLIRTPLERPECRPQSNYCDEPEKGADDRNHDDVQIAFAMGRAADREQCDHGAVVRQTVEGARAYHSDAVHQRRIDALFRGKPRIGVTERIERDR